MLFLFFQKMVIGFTVSVPEKAVPFASLSSWVNSAPQIMIFYIIKSIWCRLYYSSLNLQANARICSWTLSLELQHRILLLRYLEESTKGKAVILFGTAKLLIYSSANVLVKHQFFHNQATLIMRATGKHHHLSWITRHQKGKTIVGWACSKWLRIV